MKVAIPRFGDNVAPCFEYTATIAIFEVRSGAVVRQADFVLRSKNALDRIRLLSDQGVDTLICGGLQDRFEDMLKSRGITVISWVSGPLDKLMDKFLAGDLVAGSGRLDGPSAPPSEKQDDGDEWK